MEDKRVEEDNGENGEKEENADDNYKTWVGILPKWFLNRRPICF